MTEKQMQLPEGWAWKVMSDISDVVGGGTPKSKQREYYENGNIDWLTPADLSGYVSKYISSGARKITVEGLKKSSARLLPKGAVLFSSRAPIGYVAIAEKELSTNQGFKSFVLRDTNIKPDYVYWWLKSAKHIAERMASGTTFLELSGAKAKQLPIPIPPLNQQKQIVAKIEELFSHIDAGIESLKIAKQKLKQYRQSVLKAAVTGELTKDWREQNANAEQGGSNVAGDTTLGATKIEPANQRLKRIQTERRQRWEQQKRNEFQAKGKPPKNDKWKEKYKAPEALVGNDYFEIPEDWVLINFDTVIISGPQNGIYLPKSKYGQGIPIFRIDDFQDGFAKPYSELQKVRASDLEIEVYEVAANDLIINRVNSMTHIGKCMIVKESHSPAIFESNMMKMSLSTFVSVKYVELFINSRFGRKELIKNAKQAVNQASINQQDVKNTMIGLPSLEEQKEIVQRVEEKLTAADRLMAELDTKLTQAQQQKQTILASAFCGELV